MVPEVTNCESCGRMVIVLSWEPVAQNAANVPEFNLSDSPVTCTVDCPVCGTHVQTIVPLPLEGSK